MRNVFYIAFAAALILAMGCAITNYPVMFDTRGADDNGVVSTWYDKAYIIPSGQVATIYSDGSDELFTEVQQNWKGDQWLYTFNNFDPSASVLFLEQVYCDPTRTDDCAVVTAWNPDLPEAYNFGSGPLNEQDDIFDYVFDASCSGARSLSVFISYGSRIGECGSGIYADKQAAAAEFASLETATFRGQEMYVLPLDNSTASITLTSHMDGATAPMRLYGRFTGYIDNELRLAMPMTPNMRYQSRALADWVRSHGSANEVTFVYGGLESTFDINVMPVDLDR